MNAEQSWCLPGAVVFGNLIYKVVSLPCRQPLSSVVKAGWIVGVHGSGKQGSRLGQIWTGRCGGVSHSANCESTLILRRHPSVPQRRLFPR